MKFTKIEQVSPNETLYKSSEPITFSHITSDYFLVLQAGDEYYVTISSPHGINIGLIPVDLNEPWAKDLLTHHTQPLGQEG